VPRAPAIFNALVYLARRFVKKRNRALRFEKQLEQHVPKLLVVFSSQDAYAAKLADVVGHGAKHVRFTEVDVRAVADAEADVNDRKRLASFEALREYDGVVLVGPGPESPGHELGRLLAFIANGEPMANTVFGIAGEENGELLSAVARSGGLLVGQARGADAERRGRQLGERVAKVIGWVRHALGHEAEHHLGHVHHHSDSAQ
jgi:hypothetical protein